MAWTPRAATWFATQAVDAIREQVAVDVLKDAAVPGKPLEMPKELPGALQQALGKAVTSETLEKVRQDVVVRIKAAPGVPASEKLSGTVAEQSPGKASGTGPTSGPEPTDDQLWAEAGSVLAEDINAAIAANKQTWAKALLHSLRDELRPVLQRAVREHPELMEDRKAFEADVKEWYTEAAMELLKRVEEAGGDLALLKRGGFGT